MTTRRGTFMAAIIAAGGCAQLPTYDCPKGWVLGGLDSEGMGFCDPRCGASGDCAGEGAQICATTHQLQSEGMGDVKVCQSAQACGGPHADGCPAGFTCGELRCAGCASGNFCLPMTGN